MLRLFKKQKQQAEEEASATEKLMTFIILQHLGQINKLLAPMGENLIITENEWNRYKEYYEIPEKVKRIVSQYGNYISRNLQILTNEEDDWMDSFWEKNSCQNEYTRLTEEWEHIFGIPVKFLVPYIPVEDEKWLDAKERDERQRNRNLIWNFKYGEDINPGEHQKSMMQISQKLGQVLNDTFGYRTKGLTLFCIPASEEDIQWRRYYEFSRELCKITGMENSFKYIRINSKRIPVHLGGRGEKNYILKEEFFKGKNIVLVDDIITTGRSLKKWVAEFEKMEAEVVAALFVGKTREKKEMLKD